MIKDNKLVGSSETNNVVSTQVVLKTSKELPAERLHKAVIGNQVRQTGVDNNVKFNRMHVPVILEERDSNGNNYVLGRNYNIDYCNRLEDSYAEDSLIWRGLNPKTDEIPLFFNFDLSNGLPVVVDVGHRVNGSEVTAYIKSFHPAGYTGEVQT